MGYQPSAELCLTSHRDVRVMLFPAVAVAVVVASAWLSWILFGDPELEAVGAEADSADWIVPLVGAGALVVIVFVLWAGISAWKRGSERTEVLRVYEHGVAYWPQFATKAQWERAIARDDEPVDGVIDVIIPVGIVTVIIGALAVGFAVNGIWSGAAVLPAFLCVVIGLIAGRRWIGERDRRSNQARRRRIVPYPSCVLAADALYHEDWGLVTLDTVSGVQLVPAREVSTVRKRLRSESREGRLTVDLDPFDYQLARSGWPLLLITLDSRVIRTWRHRVAHLFRESGTVDAMPVSVFGIRVPPGREEEAADLVAAVERRWPSRAR